MAKTEANSNELNVDDHGDDESELSFTETLTTNATADDLPGPGRILGNLYNRLGLSLEKRVNNFTWKPSQKRTPLDLEPTVTPEPFESDGLALVSFDQRFKFYDLADDEPEQVLTIFESESSTNLTEDDQPGAGRLLGNLYVALGNPLERKLGALAGKLGYGPRATAVKINKYRKRVQAVPDSVDYETANISALVGKAGLSAKEATRKKLGKSLERMLKYARSGAASTSGEALDNLTTYAVNDFYLRELLLELDAARIVDHVQQEHLSWHNKNDALLSSSRRALVSLADNKLNTLVQQLNVARSIGITQGMHNVLNEIKDFLDDADRAFIVVRVYIQQIQASLMRSQLLSFLGVLIHILEAYPGRFEWGLIDDLAQSLVFDTLSSIYVSHMELMYANVLNFVVRYADMVPKTIGSRVFQWLMHYDDTKNIHNQTHAYMTCRLLKGINRSYGVDYGDIFTPDPEYLRAMYNQRAIKPLVERLLNRPEMIACKLLNQRRALGNEMGLMVGSEIPWVLPQAVLDGLCEQLVQFLDSTEAIERDRCRYFVSVLLSLDRYCRAAITRAYVSLHIRAPMPQPISNGDELPAKDDTGGTSIVRHCDKEGKFVHIMNMKNGVICQSEACVKTQILLLRQAKRKLLKLLLRRGSKFDADGHYPLVAGYDDDGRPLYIATDGTDMNRSFAICAGTGPDNIHEEVVFYDGTVRRSNLHRLDIFVLRFDPHEYEAEYNVGEAAGVVGPYAWKDVEPQDGIDQSFLTKSELVR